MASYSKAGRKWWCTVQRVSNACVLVFFSFFLIMKSYISACRKDTKDAMKEFSAAFSSPSDFVGQTSDAATGVATIIVNDAGKHICS